MPSELGELTKVAHLGLSSNVLSSTIPTELSAMTMLSNLQLEYNQLTGTVPSILGQLTRLRYMTLQGNNLSGSMPSAVCARSRTLQTLAADCNGDSPKMECLCCSTCYPLN